MSLFLLLVYLVFTYTRPTDFYPDLAPYRIMLWLGAVCGVAAVARYWVKEDRLSLRAPQISLMAGLVAAVVISQIAQGWLGGAVAALEDFGTTAAVFLMIVLVVTTIDRLRAVAFVIVASVLFLAVQSLTAYHFGDPDHIFTISESSGRGDGTFYTEGQDAQSDSPDPARPGIARLRSVGFLNDPNDFAECLLMALPILALAWKSGSKIRNLFIVILPAAVMLYAIFLTHSRGALIGLGILLFIAAWQRGGAVSAIAAAGLTIVSGLALNFTGGRSYGVDESNAGRLDAWSAGLEMFRSNPLFGIGYGNFVDNHERTAHNSFVLCFAELGIFGYFFWLALLVVTALQLNAVFRTSDPKLKRWTSAVRMSFYSFVGTALFLSRTYNVALYVILAFTVVLIECARKNEYTHETPVLPAWLLRTGMAEAASIILVYGMVRIFHATT